MPQPVARPAALLIAALAAAPLTAAADPTSDPASDLDALRDELRQLRQEVAELRADTPAGRSAARSAADRDAAVAEAMADAERRVSFDDQPLRSGHYGKNFEITGPSDDYALKIYGQLQARYVFNSADGDGNDADGVQLRRTRVGFRGHVTAGERFTYNLVLSSSSSGGSTGLENFEIGYQINPEWTATIGQAKLPFMRQELLSSSRQLGADRSVSTQYFTLDRGQGLFLEYEPEGDWAYQFSATDGADAENLDFDSTNNDDSDLALTARADHTLFGDAAQARDIVSWKGEGDALFIGGGAHVNFAQEVDDYYALTADALYESSGFSVMGALSLLVTDGPERATDWGATLESGYNLDDKWQPFARLDVVDLDDSDELVAFGVGINRFISKHNAKFTADATWVSELPTAGGRTPNVPGRGLGLQAGLDDQVSVRAQFQLLF